MSLFDSLMVFDPFHIALKELCVCVCVCVCVLKYRFNKVFDHVLIRKLSMKSALPPHLFRAIKSQYGVCEHQLEKYRFGSSLVQYCQPEAK